MQAVLATLHDRQTLAVDGKLPWFNYPAAKTYDMDYFKKCTMGKDLLVGLNTWQNDLKGKPLPGRGKVYVVSPKKVRGKCETVYPDQLDDFIKTAENIICIGGKTLYEAVLPKCSTVFWDCIYLADYEDSLSKNARRLKLSNNMQQIMAAAGLVPVKINSNDFENGRILIYTFQYIKKR